MSEAKYHAGGASRYKIAYFVYHFDMDVNIAQLLGHFVIYMVVWLFAVSIHEAAHAWISHRWGDDTALMMGRVTLNPAAHIDPLGTLLFPAIGFIAGWFNGGLGMFAWGKPTPVNPRNWTDAKWGNVSVSVAGVVANFIVVIITFTIVKILFLTDTITVNDFAAAVSRGGRSEMTWMTPLLLLLWYSMTLNLSLMIFNLIPIPPLDGGGILSSFIPYSMRGVMEMLEQYGFLILIVLMMTGITSLIMYPFFLVLQILLFNFN